MKDRCLLLHQLCSLVSSGTSPWHKEWWCCYVFGWEVKCLQETETLPVVYNTALITMTWMTENNHQHKLMVSFFVGCSNHGNSMVTAWWGLQGVHNQEWTVNRDFSRSKSQVFSSYWVQWLQSVSWETISGCCSSPAQLVVCFQVINTISWLSVFSVGLKSELSVFEISFFLPVSTHFVFPLISDFHFTLSFWVQYFLFVYHFLSVSGCGLYSITTFYTPSDQFALTLLCFVRFPTCDPCPSGFVFWGNLQ